MTLSSDAEETPQNAIIISARVRIPLQELSFSYARSSGAGGQNVNKVNTKVLLSFDLTSSPSLTDSEKKRIGQKLASRISQKGVLHVVCMRHRSQSANRQETIDRFVELLQQALMREKKRIPTKIPRAARQKRLKLKKQRAAVKQKRRGDFNGLD